MGASDILVRRKPAQKQVRLVLDGLLQGRIDQLRRQLHVAKRQEELSSSGLASPVPELERQLQVAELELEEAGQVFTFQAVGRARLEDIKRRHPPTAEQWERYREEAKASLFAQIPQFDWAALAPELISVCCIDPSLTVEDAELLWDQLSDGEAAALFDAAWGVNEVVTGRPLSVNGIAATDPSAKPSTTADNEGSPSQFSLAGQ